MSLLLVTPPRTLLSTCTWEDASPKCSLVVRWAHPVTKHTRAACQEGKNGDGLWTGLLRGGWEAWPIPASD